MSREASRSEAFRTATFPRHQWLWHEPDVGSVVLDAYGIAWQRITPHDVQGSDHESQWIAAEYSLGCEDWGGLQHQYGPIKVLHDTDERERCKETFPHGTCECDEPVDHDGGHRCLCHGVWETSSARL